MKKLEANKKEDCCKTVQCTPEVTIKQLQHELKYARESNEDGTKLLASQSNTIDVLTRLLCKKTNDLECAYEEVSHYRRLTTKLRNRIYDGVRKCMLAADEHSNETKAVRVFAKGLAEFLDEEL